MNEFFTWLFASPFYHDIVPGIYTSIIFLFLLYLFKPNLKISGKIALELIPNGSTGQTHLYSFKVVNRSLFFKVYDMQICAWVSKVEPSVNADDVSQGSINMRKGFQWVIHRLYVGHLLQPILFKNKRLEKRTNYAAQFSTFDDVKGIIINGHYITVEVLAKHSLTGFTRVITKKFKHVNDIVTGSFYSGNCYDVKS